MNIHTTPRVNLEKQPAKALDLEQVIRTETVLSRLPFHNLSKKETLEVVLTREAAPGAETPLTDRGQDGGEKARRLQQRLSRYELYWKVSPNLEFGEPRQLAYDIDTLIVNKRLDEISRPIPRWLKLGTLSSITRELGRTHKDTAQVKQALLQNASAFVTFKVSYKGRDGALRWASDHAMRYGVRLRGQVLPDGSRTEAVYINFTDTFRDIIDNTKTRPLDLAYLKSLKPAARRFYELSSYLFYAALKHNQAYAEMRYSDYCRLAPQKRLTDRHKAQTQMGKLHRPHLESGYLKSVDYVATTDAEGGRDWILRYTPGPAAVDEHLTFSKTRLRASQTPAQVVDYPNDPKRPANDDVKRNSGTPGTPSLPLTRFLELFPRARRNRKADDLAAELIARCDGDEGMAVAVVERFATLAEKTGWRSEVLYFNALFSDDGRYVTEGIEAERKASERQRRAAERRAREEGEASYDEASREWAERSFLELSTEEQNRLTEEAARRYLRDFPEKHLRRAWGPDFDARLRDSARTRAISRYRSRFPVTKDDWLAGVRSADTRPTT